MTRTRTYRWLAMALALTAGYLVALALPEPVQAEPVVIEFSAPWCEFCQAAKKDVAGLQKEGFDIRIVNVDDEPKRVDEYRIKTIPAFVVVETTTAKELERRVGKTDGAQLRALMTKHAMKPKAK